MNLSSQGTIKLELDIRFAFIFAASHYDLSLRGAPDGYPIAPITMLDEPCPSRVLFMRDGITIVQGRQSREHANGVKTELDSS